MSLLYYARLRQKILPYEQLISMVTSLLDDDAYYVQKGIGWTIREIYSRFLPREDVSSISLAATDDFNQKQRSNL